MRKLLYTLTLSAGITLTLAATPGGATPVATGCPTGHTATPVAFFTALDPDYQAPAFFDSTGNNDGIICALALPDGFRFGRFEKALGFEPQVPVIFLFGDNDSPAAR